MTDQPVRVTPPHTEPTAALKVQEQRPWRPQAPLPPVNTDRPLEEPYDREGYDVTPSVTGAALLEQMAADGVDLEHLAVNVGTALDRCKHVDAQAYAIANQLALHIDDQYTARRELVLAQRTLIAAAAAQATQPRVPEQRKPTDQIVHAPGNGGVFASSARCGATAGGPGNMLRMHAFDYNCPACRELAGEKG